MTLATNVRLLTQPHPAITHTGKLHMVQPLLTQLTTVNTANNKNSTSSETPLPISVKAIALWQDMETEARNHQYSRTGDDSGRLWQIITSWEKVTEPEWETFLENVTADWIERISTTIDPPRPRRPLRQPCAACGQRWHKDQEGQRVEAVTAWVWGETGDVAKVDNWDVQCANCGATWQGLAVAKTYWKAI